MSRTCCVCGCALSPTNTTGICAEDRLNARNGDIEGEIWCPVIGFKGWEISNQGRIRDANTHRIREPDRSGKYPRISLNGRRRAVHTLMAETWLGPRPFGALVLHDDDDKQHNHIGNLSYGDAARNAKDRERNRARANIPKAGAES
jgi:hypothetical protein